MITFIAKIAELQTMGLEEATKSKAMLFHRSPVGNSFTIHFSSQLLKEVKAHGSKALNDVKAL